MMTRIFPVTLDGEASLWYELNIEPNPFISWEEIKSSFLEAYRPAESFDEFRAELMDIRQGEKESVNGFSLRMQWMVKKWPEHEMPEKVLKGIFVDGLREEIREVVAMRGPETVEEAVKFAVVVERARRGRKGGGDQGEMKCGFCDGLHEERSCEVKRRMRELWLRSRPEGRTITPAGSIVRREEEDMERGLSLRRGGGECKCWKHQCWKRSDSVVTDVNANVNDVV
ncbi:putative retrotransposon gag domain-containing protein [Dioscorea sansibarensis]